MNKLYYNQELNSALSLHHHSFVGFELKHIIFGLETIPIFLPMTVKQLI